MSNKGKRNNLRKIEKQSSGENEEIVRMIKVFVIVAVCLLLFYFVFALYNGEIKLNDDDDKEEVEIQNIEILAGSTFNRVEDEYYVLLYDFDGDNSRYNTAIYNLYAQKADHLKMYVVDLGNSFNIKNVANGAAEVNVSSATELKVLDSTLIKIKEGKSEFAISGIDELKEFETTILK